MEQRGIPGERHLEPLPSCSRARRVLLGRGLAWLAAGAIVCGVLAVRAGAQPGSVNILQESVRPPSAPPSGGGSPVPALPHASLAPLPVVSPLLERGLAVRVLPRPPTAGEEGAGPMAAGSALLYGPGDAASVRVLASQSDARHATRVHIGVRSSLTHPEPIDLELEETAPGSRIYEGVVKVSPALVGQDSTLDRSYMVIKAGPGDDAAAFERALAAAGPVVPHLCLGSVDATRLSTGPAPDARELLAAGGAEQVTVTAGGSSDTFWGARPADWIYVSAPYDLEDGLRTLGNIRPDALGPGLWMNNTDLVIFSGGYAVDVADFNTVERGTALRGMHGVLWWKRFNGTLLGYSGAAPAAGASAIITRFVQQVAAGRRKIADERAYSAFLVETWMDIHRAMMISTAAAVDSEGNYYFVPRDRRLTLRGVQYTLATVAPWVKLRRQVWETRLAHLAQENRLMQAIATRLAGMRQARGGHLPTVTEFVTDRNIQTVGSQMGWSVEDPKIHALVRDALHARLDYERHLREVGGSGGI